jgi:hypothetical protein
MKIKKREIDVLEKRKNEMAELLAQIKSNAEKK